MYAATALRAEAHRLEQSAADPQYGSTCELFRTRAARTRELAAKIDMIAAEIRKHPSEGSTTSM